MLRIKNITKNFGDMKALDSFSYEVTENRITALVGPNGAGKTTLFDIITGVLKNDSGVVFLRDNAITNLKTNQISHLGVSRMFQQVTYFRNLTVRDHLLLCLDENEGMFSNLFADGRSRIRQLKRIRKILKLVGLSKPLNSLACELSYGQKKLLGLAMAILRPHNILLLDEPVSGVNPLLKKEIKNILLRLKEIGETIFIIEHDMNFVKEVADAIVVLNNGKLLDHGSPKKVLNNPKVIEAYLGE